MLFGNRRPRKSDARRRSHDIHRPRGEQLEDRTLLSVDLGGTSPPANPLIASAPYGMDFAGGVTSQGAGWSVADLGDVNGDGYDDFMIGAPSITSPTTLGNAVGTSEAILVFGSKTVGVSTVTDWIGKTAAGTLQYTAQDRVGNLAQIAPPTATPIPPTPIAQTNPIAGGALGFPFAGIGFVCSTLNLASDLGASVASVKLSNGSYGILIGAPFATGVDTNGTFGTGRAYLITGSFNNFIGATINLDAAPPTGLNVVTFVNNATGGQLGYSVSGGNNIFGDGFGDIILGAPSASYGATSGTGAVYALSTALLSGATQTINVSTLGQSGTQSAIFTGASSGSQAGWSVADAGDVNGVTSNGTDVDDLLIGSPSASTAYLIYGGSTLAGLAQTVNGLRYINLANVGAASSTTGAVPGATLVGPGGSLTGWAVSSGGDFNDDGFGDILIGSPSDSNSNLTTNGMATLLYGAPSTSGGYLTGTITLLSPPSGVVPLYLDGASSGAEAGYAVSPVGFINAGQPSLILVGSPGFNSDAGTAYLIPGRAGGLSGTQSLSGAGSAPLSGVQFLLSTPSAPSGSPPFLGASVSSRFQTTSVTADGDSEEDFIIGAPGYDANPTSTTPPLTLAGGAMIVQGGLITVPTPSTNQITTTIGVGTPFAPFSISASTPANLQIYVFGTNSTSPPFTPATDIDPTTVVVNGVAFPNATLTPDPNQADWVDGIQDAIITISPRSSLNLVAGTRTITISGQTLASSPLPDETWTGSASVTVTGSSSGGGSSSLLAVAAGGPVLETTFNSPFGATQYTPTISAFSAYNYAPIPLSVAISQYLPAPGFNERIYAYNHPGKHLQNYLTIRGPAATGLFKTKEPRLLINQKVYDRSRFKTNSTLVYTHKAPKIGSIYKGVVPVQQTTQAASYLGPIYKNSNRDIGSKLNGSGLSGGSGTGITVQ
jgi:FG-GAP repeat